MLQHPVPRIVLTAPPGCDRRQFEWLSQQFSSETRQKWHDGSGLNHTAAERISDYNIASVDCVHQTGYTEKRIPAQFQGIAETVIHSAQNHVHRLQALYRFQVDSPVTNRQIRAFHQSEPKIP